VVYCSGIVDILIKICSRRRCHTAVQILYKLIPGIEDSVNAAEDPALLAPVSTYITDLSLATDILIKLQTRANDARSDDTGKLKVVIAEWLNSRNLQKIHNSGRDGNESESDDDSNLNALILSLKGKDERGISNNTTGCLICPIDYDWDDPE